MNTHGSYLARGLWLLVACASLCAWAPLAVAGSEWTQRIVSAAPDGIIHLQVEEGPQRAVLTGRAERSTDITRFMQALARGQIGMPGLERVERDGSGSRFVIHLQRSGR